jgi:fructose-bisphosphate aldolase class II
MLVSGRELLDMAVAERAAVGSFNTYNLEITRAIIRAAEARRLPVFLAVGKGALDAAGFAALSQAMLVAAHEASVPIAVHLDHSPDLDTMERCLQTGFTSVMIDGSGLPFEDNLSLTQIAVLTAGGACVEAELGGVAGDEDRSGSQATEIPMTDPDEAARFVAETGVDSLAVAIGNAHGLYAGETHLDFERLAALAQRVSVPLVLHGASGINDDDLRHCIRLGIRKINVNTEIRVALFESLQASLAAGVKGYDVIRLWAAAVEAMQRVVEEKLAVFASPA